MTLQKNKTQRLTAAGLLVAVGLLLPYVCAHGIGVPGNVFLPMHIPVFLIGFICGPMYGALCGALIPALNSLITGMPVFFPMLPLMTAELCVYGAASGLIYHKTPLIKWRLGIYPALIGAMACGRAAYGALFQILLISNPALRASSVGAAFVTGIPGILVQLVVVPVIVMSLTGVKLRRQSDALASALTLIREGSASCVVMKDGKIIKTAEGRGIKPLMELYDGGILAGADVADKIIGKAASMILVAGGVKRAYGETISRAALDFLSARGVHASGGRVIDVISNREGDGICPMERAVMDISDPAQGVSELRQTMVALSARAKNAQAQ